MAKGANHFEEQSANSKSALADELVRKFNEEELARLAKAREEQTRYWSSTMMGAGEWEKQADAFADDGHV